jgi:hypothetical protein
VFHSWDEQNSLLVESHERVIAELTEEYEAKLAEEALKLEGLRSDKGALEKEAAEVGGVGWEGGGGGLVWLHGLHLLHWGEGKGEQDGKLGGEGLSSCIHRGRRPCMWVLQWLQAVGLLHEAVCNPLLSPCWLRAVC